MSALAMSLEQQPVSLHQTTWNCRATFDFVPRVPTFHLNGPILYWRILYHGSRYNDRFLVCSRL
jgi:hypothetical protein